MSLVLFNHTNGSQPIHLAHSPYRQHIMSDEASLKRYCFHVQVSFNSGRIMFLMLGLISYCLKVLSPQLLLQTNLNHLNLR